MKSPAFAKRRRDHSRIVRIGDRELVSIGLAHNVFGDLYHRCMTATWPQFFAGTLAYFLSVNALFTLLFALGDAPVANAPSGLNMQLFYFSTETLATVGYGDMHPQTHYGHLIASTEIFLGLIFSAVLTGLIFARFARPRALLIFARHPIIGAHDGKPTLMLRVANARHNTIGNANARLWLLRNEQTVEGSRFRRILDLALVRAEHPSLTLSWTLFHVIDAASPLFGQTPADLTASASGFMISIVGHDESSGQDVHARESYSAEDLRWGHRYKDIISTREDGRLAIDHRLFHEVAPDASEA